MSALAPSRADRARRLLRIALAAVLLALILRHAPPEDIASAVASASRGGLLAGLGLSVSFAALKVLRWGWLLRRLGVACSHREALRSYLGGLALGLTTPGRLGEVGRSVYLAGVDRAFVTGAALVDKVMDVAVILAVGAAGCAAQGHAGVAAGLLAAAAGAVAALRLPAAAREAVVRLVPFPPARRIAARLAGPLAALEGTTLVAGMLQAALAFGVTMIQFHLFLGAFGPAPAGATIFVLPLMILSNLIPITISGVGVREWASVLLFRQYGISGPVAVGVAWLIYLGNSLAPGVAGVLVAPRWPATRAGDATRQRGATPRVASGGAREALGEEPLVPASPSSHSRGGREPSR